MVACRITDARNVAGHAGSASSSQVPLKKFKQQTRISSVIHVFAAILHWIWPPDRCTNCHSIYSSHVTDRIDSTHNVGQIHRSVDGRFIVSSELTQSQTLTITKTSIDSPDGIIDERRQSTGSQYTSSDDGGFLPRTSNNRRHGILSDARSSWRRPLVASSSQLSLRSENSVRSFLQNLGGLFRFGISNGGGAHTNLGSDGDGIQSNDFGGRTYQNIYKNFPLPQAPTFYHHHDHQHHQRPSIHQNLHINTVTGNQPGIPSLITPNMYTPSRVSRIFSSSPASTIGHSQQSPWHITNQFSDLSTVYPSSAERSFPTPSSAPHLSNGGGQNTSNSSGFNRFRYSHELPSLRTIQEETRRMNQGFVPLQIPSPPWRGYYYHTQTPYHSYRPRTRWFPRRFSRNTSELLSPLPHLNLSMRGTTTSRGIEISPESRSSSSGFGSKNTSANIQPHGSLHSGSTSEWRLLPPYRPPPPVTQATTGHHQSYYPTMLSPNHHHYHHHQTTQQQQNQNQQLPSPPYTMGNWLDMISRLNAVTSEQVNIHKSVDVGSVDGHYEFDPSTPTPSASTPTGGLLNFDSSVIGGVGGHQFFQSTLMMTPSGSGGGGGGVTSVTGGAISSSTIAGSSTFSPTGSGATTLGGGQQRKQRTSRYDNIEARIQAMKEEFYAYRKRQELKRAGAVELESVC